MATAPRPVDRPRPVYLNLFAIRQPIPAIVSILHRVSGTLLFLVGIPLGLWALQASLASPEGFARVHDAFSSVIAKLVLLVLAWSFFHHLIAGVRHVLADAHIGLDLAGARRSAAITVVVALLLTLAVGARLW
ncbi:MAG TPA: succinate dehydrogenase, cytochrome b556 subunit [Casimicrobiaceae bacterium]|jgi:succinate dehydrogenase / fumarate reductase cytochrome b subunit